jgi:hypothetical protein
MFFLEENASRLLMENTEMKASKEIVSEVYVWEVSV